VAGQLVLDRHRHGEEVHVDRRAVLPHPTGDRVEALSPPELFVICGGLRLHVFLLRDEVLELPAGRLGGRVAEEFLGGQIPRRNPPIQIERDDGGRADLEQRFEIALLPA
jgi:hypothetical protein